MLVQGNYLDYVQEILLLSSYRDLSLYFPTILHHYAIQRWRNSAGYRSGMKV
jgi:hypothetical protein